jgi:DNA-binding transcriptional ArsR family regulator
MAPKVEALSNSFPEELRSAVKGFDDENRQAIVAALLLRGDLSFTELAHTLDISKGLLSHHLDLLLDSALLRNYSPAEFRGRYDSYYGVSSFGEAFLASLLHTLAVRTRPLPDSNPTTNNSAVLDVWKTSTRSGALQAQVAVSQAQVTSVLGTP